MAAIQLTRLTRRFGASVALHDLDLSIADGSTLAVVGPSGSGKTTLLHLIAGLIAPTAGAVRFDGEVVDALPTHRRDVALVPQHGVLFPHLDVRANIAFGMQVRGTAAADIATRIATLARQFELGALLDRHPATLSGGEARRVALARALARQPRALLLDEPTASLDSARRRDFWQHLRAARTRQPITTVLVTHDPREALALGDQLLVLAHGRAEQIGTPRALLDAPASLGVLRLLDADPIAVVPGRITADGDGRHLAFGGAQIPAADRRTSTREVLFGLRSDAIELAPTIAPDLAPASLRVTVIAIEPGATGDVVHLRGDDGTLLYARAEQPPAIGTCLHARIRWSRVHVFDGDGRALSPAHSV